MKVKDTVYKYEIKLDFKTNKVTQEQNQYKVLGVNSLYLVIDNFSFTKMKHKKQYRGDKDEFNQVSIIDTSNWGCGSDYIHADLITSTDSAKIAYRRIKKALEKYIYKKHGRYCNAISFLDQIKI